MTNQEFFSKNNVGIDVIVNVMKSCKEKDLTKFLKQKCYYTPKFKAGDIIVIYDRIDRTTKSMVVIDEIDEHKMEYTYKNFCLENVDMGNYRLRCSPNCSIPIYSTDENSHKIGVSYLR